MTAITLYHARDHVNGCNVFRVIVNVIINEKSHRSVSDECNVYLVSPSGT